MEGFHAASVNRIGIHGLIKAKEAEDETDGDHAFRVIGGYDLVVTRGAYAYLPVNGLELQETLGIPVDATLYFAGEAISLGHIGTVHGAIDTGQRAAREILESV